MRDVRDRQYELVGDVDRLPPANLDGSASVLLRTYEVTLYPSSANNVYACHPVLSDAADTEGAASALTVDTSATIYALNIGAGIPPKDTDVIAHGVGGRLVFRYDG